jgi:hypothetical protein
VEPFGDCTWCDDASRIVRAAYIEYLGREPDAGGMATYTQQLAANRTAEAVRADIWDSAEGAAYRQRLERGEVDDAQYPVPPQPKQLGKSWPPPGTLLTGAVVGGRQERSFRHLVAAPPAEETFHTAAHGLQFEIESKEDAIALTSVRTSGLAPHLRGNAASTSHLRLFAASLGLDAAGATVASDWRLLGQYNGPVPAAPLMATIPLDKPYHLGPRERVKLSLHADHPLGISVTVPSISVLAADLRKRSRAVVGGVWRQFSSLLTPEWLLLARPECNLLLALAFPRLPIPSLSCAFAALRMPRAHLECLPLAQSPLPLSSFRPFLPNSPLLFSNACPPPPHSVTRALFSARFRPLSPRSGASYRPFLLPPRGLCKTSTSLCRRGSDWGRRPSKESTPPPRQGSWACYNTSPRPVPTWV